jgi:hypothetical protein
MSSQRLSLSWITVGRRFHILLWCRARHHWNNLGHCRPKHETEERNGAVVKQLRINSSIRFDKYTFQTLGFGFTVLEAFLFIIGLLSYPIPILTGEPLPWYWRVPTASIFSGVLLVVIGIIWLIVARSMKPSQEPDTTLAHDAPEHDVELGFHCRGKLVVSRCDQSYSVVGSGMESERVSVYQ